MRILIVEDDEEVRQQLRGYLIGKPHTVDWCSTGRQALEVLHATFYDLLILDMVLEGLMTGWDVAYIKHCDPELTCIPFVIMTGMRTADVHLGAHTHAASIQAARVILQKPLDFKVLDHVVRSVDAEPVTQTLRRFVPDTLKKIGS